MLRKKVVEEMKRKEIVNAELDKKRKRKEKEQEKKIAEVHEKNIKKDLNEPLHLHPNVKNLPDSVKRLHPDCVEFCVPGDGACCLNCLAAWIYLDETQGPILGRDLNTHFAQYREYYTNKLVFPLTINISGGLLKTFDTGEEDEFLIIWLKPQKLLTCGGRALI